MSNQDVRKALDLVARAIRAREEDLKATAQALAGDTNSHLHAPGLKWAVEVTTFLAGELGALAREIERTGPRDEEDSSLQQGQAGGSHPVPPGIPPGGGGAQA
jgi:hypothetical protein